MLGFEVGQVLRIFSIRIGLLIPGKFDTIFLFGDCCLGFVWLFSFRIKFLPTVSHKLGDAGEVHVLISDLFTNSVGEDNIC